MTYLLTWISTTLSSLSTPGQIVYCLFLLGISIVLILSIKWLSLQIRAFFQNRNISFGKFKAKLPTASEENKKFTIFDSIQLLEILQAFQKMLDSIHYTKDTNTLKLQMSFAENKFEILFNYAEKLFCELMEKNQVQNYLITNEYTTYKAYLVIMKDKLITKFRHLCKENHFSEKSDEDFREYVKNNSIIMADMFMYYSKIYFPYISTIPGFTSELNKIIHMTSQVIQEIIENGRSVAEDKLKEMQKARDEFITTYEQITGSKPLKGVVDETLFQ